MSARTDKYHEAVALAQKMIARIYCVSKAIQEHRPARSSISNETQKCIRVALDKHIEFCENQQANDTSPTDSARP